MSEQEQRCTRCNGSGTEHSRYWDDTQGHYAVMRISCGGCGGSGRRVWHEDLDRNDSAAAQEWADELAMEQERVERHFGRSLFDLVEDAD
jgi:DnaJ-class molecular chaperone